MLILQLSKEMVGNLFGPEVSNVSVKSLFYLKVWRGGDLNV